MKTAGLYFSIRKTKLFVRPAQIIRLEGRSNYTYVYFTDHAPILMAKVLQAYDKILQPHGFIRTHRSHLINPLFVKELNRKGTIKMSDDTIIDISRRRKRDVLTQCFTHNIESSKMLAS